MNRTWIFGRGHTAHTVDGEMQHDTSHTHTVISDSGDDIVPAELPSYTSPASLWGAKSICADKKMFAPLSPWKYVIGRVERRRSYLELGKMKLSRIQKAGDREEGDKIS